MKNRASGLALIFLAAIVVLAACTPTADPPTATETLIGIPPENDLPTPTESVIEAGSSLAVLVAGLEVDPVLKAEAGAALAEVAAQFGLQAEQRESLNSADGAALVVAFSALPDQMIADSPATQFVTIGLPPLTPAPNLTQIYADLQADVKIGFLAGYTAALVTDDYRVGMLGTTGQPIYTQGFLNGAEYFCGLCTQLYPPFYDYPLYVTLEAGADPGAWQAVADQLLSQSVQTIFVAPGAGDDALLAYLAGRGVALIGGRTPPEAARSNWVITFQADVIQTLAQALPQVLQSGGQGQVWVQVGYTGANPDRISSGRLGNLDEIIEMLAAGIIDPQGD